MRGVFFGANARLAEIINRSVVINKIIVERKAYTAELYDYAVYIGASFHCVDSDKDIPRLVDSSEIGISCGFGVIFSENTISKFAHGIMNIHFGDLPKYRSRHPITWAMVNGEHEIGVTFHKINNQIDAGQLVHKYYVEKSFFDTLDDLERKIMSRMPIEFPVASNLLKQSNFETLKMGVYYPRVDQHFNCVDPSTLSYSQLASLFMSQRIYGGVKIFNKNMTECHVYNQEFPEFYQGYTLYKCADGILVGLK